MTISSTSIGNSPIVVTGTSTASSAITTAFYRMRINRLTWLTPADQEQKLALQDGNGKELYEFYCDNDKETLSESFDPPLLAINGIYCDDMDSGTLYIYYN